RTGDGLLTAANTRASQLLKPFPHYAGVTRFRDSVGDSWYRGVTFRLEKRSTTGLTYQIAYTLSREEDTVPERFGSRGSVVIDPNDLSKSKSVAEDDRTHVVTAYFIWELPVGPGHHWANSGWIAHALGGWRLGGIGTFASGRPLVVGVTASNGVSTGLGAYANVVADPGMSGGGQTLDRWVNTRCVHAADAVQVWHRHPDLAGWAGPHDQTARSALEPAAEAGRVNRGAPIRGAERAEHAAIWRAGGRPERRQFRQEHHRRRR